ncbi:MAG: hypothetical protein WDZ29_05055 [Balneolaceae bacterium]
MFTITRLYCDEHGESRFEEIEVPLQELGEIGALSEPVAVKELLFREVDPGYDYDFHNAPRKQYIVLLDGEIEIETSLGEKRRFGAGEILLAEDTTGKGHKTRNLTPIRRKSLFIPLD